MLLGGCVGRCGGFPRRQTHPLFLTCLVPFMPVESRRGWAGGVDWEWTHTKQQLGGWFADDWPTELTDCSDG